jgi:probable rRNA maturation factor
MTKAAVAISVAEPGWRNCGVTQARVRAAARLALARGLEHGKKSGSGARKLTILLAGDERLRELNLQFRRKNYPANVLSFPASANGDGYLGDVALALGVAASEARTAGRRFADHVLHLTVHGVLHLLGYDHDKPREAQTMECLEIAVLHELGIANPYAGHVRTAPLRQNNV